MKQNRTTYSPAVEEFIRKTPEEVQVHLMDFRKFIHDQIPEITEKIAYGIPTFCLDGKNLCHIGAGKHHIGFYPGSEAIVYFENELTAYKTSKGTIQFPLDEELPWLLIKSILEHLIPFVQDEK